MSSPLYTPIALRSFSDARGGLYVAETGVDLPFAIRRTFVVTNIPAGAKRGFHAHRAGRIIVSCPLGGCLLKLEGRDSNGALTHAEYLLDGPTKAALIHPMVWHTLEDFLPNSVMLAWCDLNFDEAEYIREHDAFQSALKAD